MTIVLDCSVALAMALPDEGKTALLAPLLDRLMDEGALVPSLWRLEVANALLMAERRGRIDASFRRGAIADLSILPIMADGATDAYAWDTTVEVAVRHRLSVYDAAYVELAKRLDLPLATLDRAMARAAAAETLQLLLPLD